MQKRIIWVLALCLALAGSAGLAAAEAPSKLMELKDPAVVFDGTILRVTAEATTPSEEIALVELNLLHPDLHSEPEAQEALATGGRLMGVYADVAVYAGDTAIDAPFVFTIGQGGRTMSRGIIYVLPPDSVHKDLTAKVSAGLWETLEGPVLEEAQAQTPVPEPIPAETVSIPADISLLEILPSNMGLIMDEETPDRSWLGGVFISSSEEAFCLMLQIEGDAQYEATCINPAQDTPYTYRFSVGNSWPPKDTQWAAYVFDPVLKLPEKLNVTLNHPTLPDETATIEVDLVAKTVKLL